MFINPNFEIIPYIVITDAEFPKIPDLNLQKDDIGKEYELECKVIVKSITRALINEQDARHQYVLELKSVEKFAEQNN